MACSKLKDILLNSPEKSGAVVTVVSSILWFSLNNRNKTKLALLKKKVIAAAITHSAKKKSESVAIDSVFFSRLSKILKILVPGIWTKEFGLIVMVAVSLICRTLCDLWSIDNYTMVESAIISMNRNNFRRHISEYILLMPLLSVVNNLLKYSLHSLKLCWRIRLSKYLYSQYLKQFTYYKMSNLDTRIANADQLLTQDVEKFCECLTDLYSNLSKPFLDILIYATKLTKAIGIHAPLGMLGYLLVSGAFLTQLRRPMGAMTVTEQQFEGEYRYVNSRLITNSEEIAFYQGNKKEHDTINRVFEHLVTHLKSIILFRFTMGFVDNIIAKYVATFVGFFVVSRPFFSDSSKFDGVSHTERLEDYYKSGRMLLKMSEAMGRVALAGRELSRLAGFTARVNELMSVLSDLNKGTYQRTMVQSEEANTGRAPVKKVFSSSPKGIIVEKDNLIKFEDVPIVTPNGEVLVESLNVLVPSGRNVLVCGPNGCGKSSLFRVLGELWPLVGGRLTKPAKGKLFYVPQRPYMTLGTLRDQIIYPDSVEEQRRKGVSDKQLEEILDNVQLGSILAREGGWENTQDWMDVLSGGQKQRIAMARIFYHKPQFAILDECTSAVSVDVEGYIYNHCRELGITLFTVSHRKSLWTYHEYYLHMDGRGSYTFKEIDDETEQFGS